MDVTYICEKIVFKFCVSAGEWISCNTMDIDDSFLSPGHF